jgi:lipoyl(octanoyl) transferase
MTPALRIIDDAGHAPGFNMAADLYACASCNRLQAVIVRLYEWRPACVTIGYMQKASALFDRERLARDGVAWIRRPTGGRAVLHEADITYSCVFPAQAEGMGKTVMETYGVISRCLMAGFERLGIECDSHDSGVELREAGREIKLPCFLAPNRREIMVRGRKLAGSAQKRSADAVLQHGSIPFTPAYRRLPEYLQLSEKQREVQKELLASKSICISEIDPKLTLADVRRALIEGFVATLPFEVVEKPWMEAERTAIENMAANREFKNRWMEDAAG